MCLNLHFGKEQPLAELKFRQMSGSCLPLRLLWDCEMPFLGFEENPCVVCFSLD